MGIDTCLKAGITAIFFTGKLVGKEFRNHYSHVNIPSALLVSPPPAANMYIGGLEEYKALKTKNIIHSPYEYRLLNYRQMLLK